MTKTRSGLTWLVATAALVVALSGCSSSTSGKAAPTGSATPPSSTSPSSTSPSSTAQGGFPIQPAALASLLKSGAASLTSAHITFVVRSGGQSISLGGDEALSNGTVKDFTFDEQIPGVGSITLLSVGGKLYVKLPPSQRQAAKPWTLATANSTNTLVRAMAGSLKSASAQTGVDSAAILVSATNSVNLVGTETLDGAKVGHYRIVVNIAKLPSSFQQKQTLQKSGLTTLPVELYVDEQGRTRKLTESITVGSTHADTIVTLSKLDAPVSITAPPASQVSTR